MKRIYTLVVFILGMGITTINAQCNASIGGLGLITVTVGDIESRTESRGIMPGNLVNENINTYVTNGYNKMSKMSIMEGRDTIYHIGTINFDINWQGMDAVAIKIAAQNDPDIRDFFESNNASFVEYILPFETMNGPAGTSRTDGIEGMNAAIWVSEESLDYYYNNGTPDEDLEKFQGHEWVHDLANKSNSELHHDCPTLGNPVPQNNDWDIKAEFVEDFLSGYDFKMSEQNSYVDYDGDCFEGDLDCDESNASINAGATEIPGNGIDEDCDGNDGVAIDADGDGYTSDVDCDDNNPNINPGMDEICGNDIDDNCDGEIDEGFNENIWYYDRDEDGFGDENIGKVEIPCAINPLVDGFVDQGGDCDDNNPDVNPDADEICGNGIDDNCDGELDEGLLTTYYADIDGDGFGDIQNFIEDCGLTAPIGYVDNRQDCDDNNPNVFINAPEICDGVDNDCDGRIDGDDSDLVGGTTYYLDSDEDGYGDVGSTRVDCSQPSGYVTDNTDCDDGDADINPAATEVLNNDVDENCDGIAEMTQVIDNDGDGFDSNVDCDDNNPNINPGQSETPYNGVDDDCDPATLDDDLDQDGFVLADDCDDGDADINPDATEVCDAIDNNCDGDIDNGLPMFDYYTDVDGDGYGDDATLFQDCSFTLDADPAISTIGGDCDDTNADINPDAEEIPDNGIDDDCDGMIDEILDTTHELGNTTISISPNPATDIINIQVDGDLDLQYRVFNINGQLLLTSDIGNIEISPLPRGVLLLEITDIDSGSRAVERIIKN